MDVVYELATNVDLTNFLNSLGIEPLASYINLHYSEVWSLAIIQLCIRGGIYAIINLKNKMIYIGKSTIGNLHDRLKSHLIRISSNNSLYADVIKHGVESFAFILLSSVAIDGIITLCPQIFDSSIFSNISGQLSQLDINNILHLIEISSIAFLSGPFFFEKKKRR